MTQFISPGVYVLERDLSQYVSDLSSTIVAIVGTADKGPTNVPTLITSASELSATFGNLNPNHYLSYAAQAYLKQGSILYVTRVAAPDSAKARLTTPIPASYTAYAGDWVLESQTASSATFTISNTAPTTATLSINVNKTLVWTGGNWKNAGVVAGSRITLAGFTNGVNNATFDVASVDTVDATKLTLSTSSTLITEASVTTASFLVSAKQFVALQDASFQLPGFDFQDTTGVEPIQGKLGSDLLSFVTAGSTAVDQYVKGRNFKIVSGVGKDSVVGITGLSGTGPTLSMTVDARKFNSFNSPLLTTAAGSLTFKAGTLPASNAVLAIIGGTSTGGVVQLIFNEPTAYDTAGEKDTLITTLNAGGAGAITALDALVSVTNTVDVSIKVPLYNGTVGGTVDSAEAIKNNTLTIAILNAIITAFRANSVGSSTLLAASAICKATANGITGIGYVDAITGISEGIKSAVLSTTDNKTVILSAIVVGAFGNLDPAASTAVVSSTPLQISGSFSTDLYRPTWVVSTAGTSTIPTLFKFSSIGEADLSNMAIVVGINNNRYDSLGNLQYVVSLYHRIDSSSVSTTSTVQSDFLLFESFEGTPEVLQSTISASSSYISLKIDYSTEDTLNVTTGVPVYGTVPDYLTSSFALAGDLSGLGALAGVATYVSGTTLTPAFADFLLGGSLGTDITKYDILGDASLKTGIYSFSDPEQIDINVLLAPGWSADPAVAKGMVALCESRGDCMAILDTPFGLTVQNVVNYKNNVLNINSSYAAIYYPWVKITDAVNKKDIFVPPSGLVAGQYAYNDLVGEVFSAPAGRNRGNLSEAIATERILNQGDRDVLTLAHINPIHYEAGYGIYIRGQMTMQTATTALDRVNVRRLLLNLRKVIATASKAFEFEPGDAITALRLKQLAESTLEDRLRKGAIRSYTVDVGPNVNTVTTLENNELRMSISLVPTKTAEKIIEVFNILGQGQGISLGA